ncbi:hypothetical protein KHP62_04850 [Rhodobacteraceae bacterium NNCM2]|nr:hypothetical protein [Coraliihabitans acroporae]
MAISVSLGAPDEKRAARRARAGRLALELTTQSIVLYHEATGGRWEMIGHALLESRDFNKQIEWLRVEALARTGQQQPVMIWLPDDQVLRRSFAIGDQRPAARRNIVADLFERETPYRRDELEIAVAPDSANGKASCLAILRQTRREAEDYARRWGFEPGIVTIREAGDGFDDFARFTSPDQPGKRIARTGVRWGAIGAGIIGAGTLAAAGAWGLALFMQQRAAPPAVPTAIAMPAAFEATDLRARFAEPQDPAPISSADLALTVPAAPEPRQPVKVSYDEPWVVAYIHPDDIEKPSYLHVDDRLKLGRVAEASVLPLQFASLGETATGIFNPAGRKAETDASVVEGGVLTWNVSLTEPADTGLSRTPYSNSHEPIFASLAAVADAPLTAPMPFPRVPDGDEIAPPAPAPETEAATLGTDLLAPRPVPRPVSDAAPEPSPNAPELAEQPEAEAQTAALSEPAEERAPVGEAPALVALAAPEPKPADADLPAPLEAEAAILGIETSPMPQPRPERTHTKMATVRTIVPRSVVVKGPVSRSVSKAASHQGIPLDRTSLIGIIDMTTGREALLRLPSGRFRRVGKGDQIDGWEVSMIGRDAMRLVNGSEQRTLLLVDR